MTKSTLRSANGDPDRGRHTRDTDDDASDVQWLELPRRSDSGAHRPAGAGHAARRAPRRRRRYGSLRRVLVLAALVGLAVVVAVPLLHQRPTAPTVPATGVPSPPVASSAEPGAASPSPAPSTPGLLWSGDAETGDLSQYQAEPTNSVGGTPPVVETTVVRDGRYAIALGLTGATTTSDGICCGSRNELLPKFRDLQEGDELWFGFSTYLAAGFPTDAGWQLITQFKQNFDGSPPLGLYVEEGRYKVEGGYGHPSGPRPFMIPLGPASSGQWVDWVWHVKFSSDPGVGFVEVWQNGQPVVPRFAPRSGTLYPGTGDRAGSYVKTGPYREQTITAPATLYLDGWKIGTSRAAVARP